MMETLLSRSIRAICLGGMTLGMTAAIAQEASAPLQRVEVTGSRIRQVDLETAQPIQVMNQEQIQKSGLVTVGDVLNNLASAGTPDYAKGTSLSSDIETGGQYINLRNLGSNRLLVLVDGKRWTQSINGFTDMSTIPSAMIERIEVLKDGASSIYGSDAIAGVVNIILKRSMQGGQLSMYTGQNEKNDGKNKDFSLTYGAGDDKASLMFGLSHTEQGAVFPGTRNRTSTTYGPQRPTDGLGASHWGRITPVNPVTGQAVGSGQMINHSGSWQGGGTSADVRDPNNYHAYTGIPDDQYNTTQDMHLTMPTKLDTLFVKGEVNLPLDMRFKTTAMYSQRTSSSQIAGYPVQSLSQAAYPVYLDKNSYYNPYGNSVVGDAAAQDMFFYRRTSEMKRVSENESRTMHVDATLEGEFDLRGNPWNWSVGYNHSSNKGTIQSTGNINLINLKRALGPSFMNAAGVVQCGTPGAPILLSECTPFNIVGGPSASTPEALAYVNATGMDSYESTVNSATADISGELFALPAGGLGFAAGIEHREVRGNSIPDQLSQDGYTTALSSQPTYGRYTVREAYAELNIPVLKNLPFAEMLSFNLATRHSDYSNFGTTNNSKVSFMWKPVRDVLARGTWAEGFRAPSLGDTFGGGSQSFDRFLDPCDTRFGAATRDAAVLARCIAAGTSATYRQKDVAQVDIPNSSGAQGTKAFLAGEGNASLQPETATTKTLGLVYNPSFIPGFSASVDWYNIRINNRITGLSASYIINQCYVSGAPSFCSTINRDATSGQIVSLSRGNANLGQLETEGYDVSLSYRLPRTAYGQFTLRNETSYVDKYAMKADAEAGWINYAGQYDYDYGVFNRVKSNTSLDWNLGNWSATWTARYSSPIKDSCFDVEAGIECNMPNYVTASGTGANKLGSLVYHDMSVGYKTSWDARVLFGVNNVFDKGLRTVYNAQTSAVAIDTNQPLDRFFYVRYTQNF